MGLSCEQANANLRDFLLLVPCLPEPPDMVLRWQKVVTRYAVAGKQAHDARLVALMEAHALNRILTFNAMDFARYSFVQSVSPAQLLAASTVQNALPRAGPEGSRFS
jgi:predicted nucleic acid-binding protein